MNGSFHLASVRAVSSPAGRIVSTVHDRDFSVFILFKADAFDKIRMHKADFISRKQAEIFPGRFFHEIVPLDKQLPGERYLPCSQRLVFRIVGGFQLLRLPFRIVVNHQPDGIQHCHHAGSLQLQIVADAVFQHGVIRAAVCLGNPRQLYEFPNGLRRVAAPAQGGDRDQTGIIPSVYGSVFHQFFDIPFSGHHIGQIKFCELNLFRRMRIFQLRYHPVVQRTVILKLQRTQRMRHALNGILNRMRKIIHRVDAPLIARVMVRHPGNPVDHRIPHVNIRGGHVDLCPQHLAPVREFSGAHSPDFPPRSGSGKGFPFRAL